MKSSHKITASSDTATKTRRRHHRGDEIFVSNRMLSFAQKSNKTTVSFERMLQRVRKKVYKAAIRKLKRQNKETSSNNNNNSRLQTKKLFSLKPIQQSVVSPSLSHATARVGGASLLPVVLPQKTSSPRSTTIKAASAPRTAIEAASSPKEKAKAKPKATQKPKTKQKATPHKAAVPERRSSRLGNNSSGSMNKECAFKDRPGCKRSFWRSGGSMWMLFGENKRPAPFNHPKVLVCSSCGPQMCSGEVYYVDDGSSLLTESDKNLLEDAGCIAPYFYARATEVEFEAHHRNNA